jgi:replicative DNA helicase
MIHDEAAEQVVLSACLMGAEPSAKAAEILTPADFYAERHRILFTAVLALLDMGSPVDPHTLVAELDRTRELESAGGRDYVGWLIDVAPIADNVAYHAGIVLEFSRKRRMAKVLSGAIEGLTAGDTLDAVTDTLEQRLAALRSGSRESRSFDDKSVMADAVMAYLEGEGLAGTPYGFAPLDAAALPLLPGHLALAGGASGSGKSMAARNVLREWVGRYKRRVGWLTCEMTGEEQLAALTCMDLGLDLERYYRRLLTRDERAAFRTALGWWRDCDLLSINELGSVTPDRALRIFRRWREKGVDHFVLDHLHRLDYGATKSGDDLRVPMADAARSLKNFAKDQQAVVLALVQYSKIKPHEEPDDSKIREANNILEEADAVFHIYRPYVAHERLTDGSLRPLTAPNGFRFFEGSQLAPKGSILAHDSENVYLKLGKQRRRIRDGLVRIPFNRATGLLYDTPRVMEKVS